MTDHSDKAIPTDGARAKATIQHEFEKATIQVELEPSGDNTLKGTGAFTITPDTGIIVFLKLPEQVAYAARFNSAQDQGRNRATRTSSQAETLIRARFAQTLRTQGNKFDDGLSI